MIDRDEIEARGNDLGVHIANVERDYVFGWLLKAFYENSYLASMLILKGGNCMRKAYYPNTRFSADLDFSVLHAVDADRFREEINHSCIAAQSACGVTFETERNTFAAERMIDGQRQVFKGRVYFRDFYGNHGQITIAVRLDVSEFDKVFLPTVQRELIHPYSDSDACRASLQCMAMEELLANKLKCLLQRRHSFDLYDFVYATFFERAIEVDRGLLLRTFLRKTIYERSPVPRSRSCWACRSSYSRAHGKNIWFARRQAVSTSSACLTRSPQPSKQSSAVRCRGAGDRIPSFQPNTAT